MLWQQLNSANRDKPLSVNQLQAILDELQYPWRDFTIDGFVAWVGKQKGRRVEIMPFAAKPKLFGAWVGTLTGEYFCHGDDIDGRSRALVLAHEVSHWLLLHSTKRLTPADLERLLVGEDLDLNDLQIVQQRSAAGKKGWEDVEAERLAAMILARATTHHPPTIVDPSLREYLDEWR